MNNTEMKKKHSTTMREFRELEKRLLNIEREHNKLLKQRKFYCKSASSNRPYLSERIVAKLRPQTASLGYFKNETFPGKGASKDTEMSAGLEEELPDIDERRIAYGTEEFEVQPSKNVKKYGDNNDCYTKNRKSETHTTRITSSRICSRNSSANNHNRPVSVGSRNSSAWDRNSSANSRSAPSEISRRNKSWVYHPMTIHPERQSIYTLLVPPVQMAEESKRGRKKRKRQGGRERHVAWMDNDEHVLRFQGIPRHVYNHEKEQPNREHEMEQLKHCRYLR
jgi:hypothetical protein